MITSIKENGLAYECTVAAPANAKYVSVWNLDVLSGMYRQKTIPLPINNGIVFLQKFNFAYYKGWSKLYYYTEPGTADIGTEEQILNFNLNEPYAGCPDPENLHITINGNTATLTWDYAGTTDTFFVLGAPMTAPITGKSYSFTFYPNVGYVFRVQPTCNVNWSLPIGLYVPQATIVSTPVSKKKR